MEEKSYLKGIIGGLIGGFIASIPWVLMYVYGNMILSLLAIIIAIGVLKGYQLLKGKVDSKLPIIVIVISVIVVTVSTLIIIPSFLILKEGWTLSQANFEMLYASSEFSSAIIKDYIISLFFTFLGISGVVSNIKKQVASGETKNIKANLQTNNENLQETIEKFKQVFTKYNALSKDKAIEKERVLKEINEPNSKNLFNSLRLQQIILKSKGRYYFSLKNEKSVGKRFVSLYLKIMVAVIVIAILITLLFSQPSHDENNNVNNNYISITQNEVSYEIPTNFQELTNYREEDNRYYTFKKDLTGYLGFFSVTSGTSDFALEEVNDFKSSVENFMTTSYQDSKITVETYTNKNNYTIIKAQTSVSASDEEKAYSQTYYYIVGNYKFGLISLTDYYVDGTNLDKIVRNLIDSFNWNNENV